MTKRKKRELNPQQEMRNKQNKVANHANERASSPTKAERRLAGRVKDYNSIPNKTGYHQPGSYK